MVELVLFTTFAVAVTLNAMIVWRKIPLLLQVPQQLIEESFVTRPSRLRRWFAPVAAFFREQRYRDLSYVFLVAVLRRLRLRLLRLERLTFRVLERLEARRESFVPPAGRYWTQLRTWKQETRENGRRTISERLPAGDAGDGPGGPALV